MADTQPTQWKAMQERIAARSEAATLRRIVVATSLRQSSDEVLVTAAELARRSGAELHLVHAYQLPVIYGRTAFGLATVRPEILDADRQRAEESLLAQLARVGLEEGELASVEIEADSPHRSVLSAAQKVDADLLVLGATESPEPLATLLGSTADRVLREAQVPVWIVRTRAGLPQRILAPVDLAPQGNEWVGRGLALLRRVAGRSRCQLRLLHVIRGSRRDDGEVAAGPADTASGELVREALQQLSEELVQGKPTQETLDLSVALREGRPKREILREASRFKADLLILAKRHHRGLEHPVFGSVLLALAHRAEASLLVLPEISTLRTEEKQTRVDSRA